MEQTVMSLREISTKYKIYRSEFFRYSDVIIDQFTIDKIQKRQLAFGLIETKDSELQKYADELNENKKLQELSWKLKRIKLKGNVIILQYIEGNKIKIPGYDIQKMLNQPENNIEEINDIILSIGGYEHIRIIDQKIMQEVPISEYLIKNTSLIQIVDQWLVSIDTFSA